MNLIPMKSMSLTFLLASFGDGEDHDMTQNHGDESGSGGSYGSSGSSGSSSTGSTGGSMQGGTAYSGINAVRPEYNWDDDIPMLSRFRLGV